MTQVSRAAEVTNKILEELQKYHTEFPNKLGMPSKDLEKRVGLTRSPMTFTKYMRDLADNGFIETGIRDPENYARKLVRLNSNEAQAKIALGKAEQKIQEVFSRRIAAQSSKEYGRIAEKVLPKGFVDAGTQREVDSFLAKQPHTKTAYEALRLVIIAHDCYAKVFGHPGDLYISVRAPEIWPGSKEPVPTLSFMGSKQAEDNERDASALGKVVWEAAKKPELMRLLTEIDPDLEDRILRWGRPTV